MDIGDFIRLANREPALPFLVIGGYAVAAHGHARATFDVDFLAQRSRRDLWRARLAESGVKLLGESSAFDQYTPPQGQGLDIMWVENSTFDPISEAAEFRDFGGVQAKVPCLDHLLALKLHSLRHAGSHRTSKDADDLEVIIRRHGLDLRTPHYEALFLRYGNREIYETFLRLLRDK